MKRKGTNVNRNLSTASRAEDTPGGQLPTGLGGASEAGRWAPRAKRGVLFAVS